MKKMFLKIDLLKALTASGGLAQALEKQDLEPKITNAAKKSDKDKKKKDEEDAEDSKPSS